MTLRRTLASTTPRARFTSFAEAAETARRGSAEQKKVGWVVHCGLTHLRKCLEKSLSLLALGHVGMHAMGPPAVTHPGVGIRSDIVDPMGIRRTTPIASAHHPVLTDLEEGQTGRA